jgi:hypothetical protein
MARTPKKDWIVMEMKWKNEEALAKGFAKWFLIRLLRGPDDVQLDPNHLEYYEPEIEASNEETAAWMREENVAAKARYLEHASALAKAKSIGDVMMVMQECGRDSHAAFSNLCEYLGFDLTEFEEWGPWSDGWST